MFTKGQIVYSVIQGEGLVIGEREFPAKEIQDAEPTTSGFISMIQVEFKTVKNSTQSYWYLWDGKKNYNDKNPELYAVPVEINKLEGFVKKDDKNFIL